MADFALPALATAAAALLTRSGVAHLWHRKALRGLLDRQALLPTALRPIVADGLGPVELTFGLTTAAILVGAVAGDETVSPDAIGWSVAALGAAFALFLLVLARSRPTAPCGCGGGTGPDDEGVGPLDGLRAAIVLGGGLALAGSATTRLAALDPTETATVLTAGLALAAVIDVASRAASSPSRPAPATINGAPS